MPRLTSEPIYFADENIIEFPNDRNLPAARQQQTFFDGNTIGDPIQEIMDSIQSLYNLTGLILYAADYGTRSLHLRSFTDNRRRAASEKEIFKVSLPFDPAQKRSCAAHVYSTRLPYFSPDSMEDRLFDKETMELVGVSGAAYGIPLNLDHRVYGVLIAWASPDSLTETIQEELRVQASGLTTILAKANRDKMKFNCLSKLTQLTQATRIDLDERSVYSVATDIAIHAMFERVRIFKKVNGMQDFELVHQHDTTAQTKYELRVPQTTVSARRKESAYFDFICADLQLDDNLKPPQGFDFGKQLAYVFRSGNFGEDPNAKRFDRADDLPWIVVPMISLAGLHGYFSVDNRTSRRFFRSENIAYLQATAWLVNRFLAHQAKLPVSDLTEFQRYLRPIYTSLVDGKIEEKGRSEGLYESEDERPVRYVAPNYKKDSVEIDKYTGHPVKSSIFEMDNQLLIDKYQKISGIFGASAVEPLEADVWNSHRFLMQVPQDAAARVMFSVNRVTARIIGAHANYADQSGKIVMGFKSCSAMDEFLERAEARQGLISHIVGTSKLDGPISEALDLNDIIDFIPGELRPH